MLVVDVVMILILIVAVIVGSIRGFSGTVGLLVGLVVGGFAAYWLVPVVNDAWPGRSSRPVVVIVVAFLLIALGGWLGAAVGAAIRRGFDRTPLRAVDRILGGAASVVVAALALSLAGTSIGTTGAPMLAPALSSSVVLRTIDRFTPPPVAEALAQLRATVIDEGIPNLALLLDAPPTDIPPVDLEQPALTQAAASVARVSGTAYACGLSATGSGFVIAEDRVVTNAHVVAGVDTPIVELPGVPAREGRIVYFDSVDDLAVIAVDGLGVAPLAQAPTLAAGSAAVVQGYPLGGPFTSMTAGVLSVGTAPVPDIYDAGQTPREVYALEARVQPGNSGGPLLTPEGAVAGVVFARAQGDPDLGYAMTMAEFAPVAAQAAALADSVDSGACTG